MIAAPQRHSRMHLDAMEGSVRIGRFTEELVPQGRIMVSPKKVIAVLNKAGVRFVLMGAYGLAGWRKERRSTDDVDVLVVRRDLAKAVKAVRASFPTLEVRDTPVVIRFVDPKSGIALIDLMKPVQKVFQMVFRHTVAVGETHRVPDLEMSIVSKFAAMVSPHRPQERKMQDGVDFLKIVKRNLDEIDVPKLVHLADQTYSGGGKEIRLLIEDIRAGRDIRY